MDCLIQLHRIIAAKCGYGLMIYAIAQARMTSAGETSDTRAQPAT